MKLSAMLTVRQAAERLGISTQRVYQLVESGKLPAHQNAVGGLLFSEKTISQRIKQFPRPTAPTRTGGR